MSISKSLPRLKRLGVRLYGRDSPVGGGERRPVITDPAPEELYPVGAPFDSMWEVYVWKWLMKIDDRWAPHILIGPKDVDFFHPVKLAVIEIDGEYWHSTRQATDLILRKAIESMGVKVRVLRAASFEQLKRGLPGWYGMNF